MNKLILAVKGEPDHYEVSVVREVCHAEGSWGWFGPDKILIAESRHNGGGHIHGTINRTILDLHKFHAIALAEVLNDQAYMHQEQTS